MALKEERIIREIKRSGYKFACRCSESGCKEIYGSDFKKDNGTCPKCSKIKRSRKKLKKNKK